jgi:hypothetical protein
MSHNTVATSASRDLNAEKNSFFTRLREAPRIRSFNEHVAAVHGLPLDAVQLLLRSKLPRGELRGNRMTAAAIVKTLHDLRFWEPLVAMGLANSFKLHQKALEDDRAFLALHQPDTDNPELLAIWTHTLDALQQNLPSPTGSRQAA